MLTIGLDQVPPVDLRQPEARHRTASEMPLVGPEQKATDRGNQAQADGQDTAATLNGQAGNDHQRDHSDVPGMHGVVLGAPD